MCGRNICARRRARAKRAGARILGARRIYWELPPGEQGEQETGPGPEEGKRERGEERGGGQARSERK
jgi:hypothetical protein